MAISLSQWLDVAAGTIVGLVIIFVVAYICFTGSIGIQIILT